MTASGMPKAEVHKSEPVEADCKAGPAKIQVEGQKFYESLKPRGRMRGRHEGPNQRPPFWLCARSYRRPEAKNFSPPS